MACKKDEEKQACKEGSNTQDVDDYASEELMIPVDDTEE